MSSGESGIGDEFITLGRVIKTQGRKGEVAVELHTAIPDRFRAGMRIFALAEDNSRRELEIEELWPHKGWLILKFRGVDSISDAEAFVRSEVQVPRSERAPLERGLTYVSDLIGCVLFDGEREIGRIEDVRSGAGEAPLLIMRKGKEEYEIPYAEAYLTGVEVGRKVIRMALPEGMLEVNAPLTPEEKRHQAGGEGKRRRK
ncbi:MAG: 16S rRNA processing protein RimM [Acidobacteria bacterium]|nr:MAG: 16S rRNA processing protein RimM [Acidobacteriota bacterium]